MISKLYAAHHEGKATVGFNIESEVADVCDVLEASILDLYITKYWGIKLAAAAACTVLRIDQVSWYFIACKLIYR